MCKVDHWGPYEASRQAEARRHGVAALRRAASQQTAVRRGATGGMRCIGQCREGSVAAGGIAADNSVTGLHSMNYQLREIARIFQ